jgi:DNA-binding IclR family transcriptional regulator
VRIEEPATLTTTGSELSDLLQPAQVSSLRTVARVVEVIELVARQRDDISASEIATRLGMPMSSAHSVIRRLLALGYLELATDRRRYRSGPRLIRLGIRVVNGLRVVEVARPVIKALAAATGEDVYLAVRQSDSIIYAEKVEGDHHLRLNLALGDPRPLHASAAGKLFLAFQDERRVSELLEKADLFRFTLRTVTDRRRLDRDLRAIRRAGYAVTLSEHIEGVTGIAAPIRDSSGHFVAAITVPLPRNRFLRARHQLIRQVVGAACEVSAGLGWIESPTDLIGDTMP